MNTQAVNGNQVITKSCVDPFRQENERSRRDLELHFYDESSDIVKNNQDKSFQDNNLTNIDSITANRNPTSDNELANKKYNDDDLDKNKILRFNQTLQNYLKVSVGNDTYNLTKYDKIQIIDTTVIKYPNNGGYLLQNWNIKCNDKNGNGKIQNFVKSTKTHSITSQSGATSLSPIGDSFMCIETSGGIFGNKVFCSWERTDIIQLTNISFYYTRY